MCTGYRQFFKAITTEFSEATLVNDVKGKATNDEHTCKA